jgi:hypothetical protein
MEIPNKFGTSDPMPNIKVCLFLKGYNYKRFKLAVKYNDLNDIWDKPLFDEGETLPNNHIDMVAIYLSEDANDLSVSYSKFH